MRPKNRVPTVPELPRETAEMDTTPDEVAKPVIKIEPEETKPVTTEKKQKKRNYSEWYAHVNKFKADNPGIAHSEAVRRAKETYTKTPKVKRDTSNHKPNPWMLHIKECLKNNPDWRSKHAYKDVLKKCKETYKKSTN